MKNIFKTRFLANTNLKSRKQVAEILDSDEDKITFQYNKYHQFIQLVKQGILQTSQQLLIKQRRLRTH